jgi:hypothetical protein
MHGKPLLLAPVLGVLWMASLLCLTAPAHAAQEDSPAIVLHLDTREAVLDVVARDRHNLPIADLAAKELQVYEIPDHGARISRRVLSLRTIDPERKNREEDATSGFHVTSGAVCALDAAVHYQIAIPASSQPGYPPFR